MVSGLGLCCEARPSLNLGNARQFVRLGALGVLSGDAATRANAIVDALFSKLSTLRRDVAEAVAVGDLGQASNIEVNAIEDAIQSLATRMHTLEASGLADWIASSREIDTTMDALRASAEAELAAASSRRRIRVGLGFALVAAIAGGAAYWTYRNRGKWRR